MDPTGVNEWSLAVSAAADCGTPPLQFGLADDVSAGTLSSVRNHSSFQARQVIIMISEDPSEPYSATEVLTVGQAWLCK